MKTISLLKTRLLWLVFTWGFAITAHAQSDNHVVKTESGLVSGVKSETGVVSYKGIPFAQPPIGDLRWRAPQPVKAWEGVRKCDAFGPSPVQGKPAPFSMWSQEFLIPQQPISEDCLYLNIWTGALSSAAKRPVLVWIYGGGFTSGGSAVPIYDGEAMASNGVIFVSFNYRVGVFGFFSHPELSKESGHNASGNYGLMDQIAAIKWVKKNITAFGGDPDNVTIAGQSAGSMSVNDLLASPLAKGLFQKAIAESGAAVLGNNGDHNELQDAEQQGLKIAGQLNAPSLADLRKIPAEQLLKEAHGGFRPIVDGYVLPQSVHDCFVAGNQSKVPLLTGWNQNEGLFFGKPKSAEDFKKDIEQQYGPDAGTFLQYYPAGNDEQASQSQLAYYGRDLHFGIQEYALANMQSKSAKVYVYRFTRIVPATGQYVGYGAFHTGEVPYAYGNLKFVNRPWESVDFDLTKTMLTYWANFIKSGNPNGTDLPVWPVYDQSNNEIMVLSDHPHAEKMPDKQVLEFLLKKQKY